MPSSSKEEDSFVLKFWVCFIVGLVILLGLFRGLSAPPTAPQAKTKREGNRAKRKKKLDTENTDTTFETKKSQ